MEGTTDPKAVFINRVTMLLKERIADCSVYGKERDMFVVVTTDPLIVAGKEDDIIQFYPAFPAAHFTEEEATDIVNRTVCIVKGKKTLYLEKMSVKRYYALMMDIYIEALNTITKEVE